MLQKVDGSARTLSEFQAKALKAGSDHYTAYVGPPKQYDYMGATQFRLLTALGLREHHKLLDFGCGSLRAGRLLIPYLDPGNYFGLEPNAWLIEDAFGKQLGQDIRRLKRPVFRHHDSFTADEFRTSFDFIVAQSIFSHAGPQLARTALASFRRVLAEDGIVLATFIHGDEDTPEGWRYPGCLKYRKALVREMLDSEGLVGKRLDWFHPRQSWWIMAKDKANIPNKRELALLSGVVLRDRELAAGVEAALRRQEQGDQVSLE